MAAAEKWMTWLVRLTAYAGGLVLVFITLVTVASILGRAAITMANASDATAWHTFLHPLVRIVGGFFESLGARPVPGDYEMVEAGAGFAVFAFLPWAMMERSHATVDMFAPFFPNRFNRFIDLLSDFLMLLVALFVGWRHLLGTVEKIHNGETTFILQYPTWWGYAASLIGISVFIMAASFCVFRSYGNFTANRTASLSGAAG